MNLWKYRPEVDGLRAVAVLLVVLFHADLGFQGGFVGVDAFFVISGFLITGIILNKQLSGQFLITEFWERRIRRILPASILMVLAVLGYASFSFMPRDFMQLGETALYQQCLMSNIYLWRESGYFNNFAELNPLLHTWSLAVEEQFYLFYPFLLMWLGRFREVVRFRVLAVLLLFSFIGSEYAVHSHPEMAFFLLPTRAWEMLLGGMICFLPALQNDHSRLREGLSLLSISGLILCGWCYHSELPFPGLYAAVPCLLTAVFIAANLRRQTAIGRLMSSRSLVFVGLISYSLYLAHWPILAFLRYHHGHHLILTTRLFAVVVSFLLAIVSWRWIEQPFRRRTILPQPRYLILATILVPAMLITISYSIHEQKGFPKRLPQEARSYLALSDQKLSKKYQFRVSPEEIRENQVPFFGASDAKHKMLVWGDSHAMALMPGIDAVCQNLSIKCYQITYPGSTPLLNYGVGNNKDRRHRVPERNQAAYEFIVRHKIPLVVLVAYWGKTCQNHSEIFEQSVRDTIDQLELAGVHVMIMEDNASFDYMVPHRLAQFAWYGKETAEVGLPLDIHYEYNRVPRAVFQSLTNQNVRVYDPTPYFAGDSNLWPAQIGEVSMIRDRHHLSVAGAMRLKPLIERAVMESVPQLATESKNKFQ